MILSWKKCFKEYQWWKIRCVVKYKATSLPFYAEHMICIFIGMYLIIPVNKGFFVCAFINSHNISGKRDQNDCYWRHHCDKKAYHQRPQKMFIEHLALNRSTYIYICKLIIWGWAIQDLPLFILSIPRLLIAWWHSDPGHQQSYCWLKCSGITTGYLHC